jgi:two-component system, OmpR family, sensor histidine kinase BaeS
VIPSPLRSSLATRLAGAFVVVALAAVVVLSGLTLWSARSEVSSLVRDIHEQDTRSTAAAASQAYASAGGWDGADLTSPAAVAASGQAELTVRDATGAVIAAPASEAAAMMAEMHGIAVVDVPRGDPRVAPVMVDGQQVGTVELRFPTSHLPTPERQIRDALSRNVLVGAALAIAAAVAVGVVVARRVGMPITALTSAASRMQQGDRSVRVDPGQAPAEIAALASTFNHMAESIEREDELRRRLVADVAHELRTPLTILRATTEALVDEVAEPDRETLSSLHDEVLRLGRLVGDLELLAAADAAGLDLDRRRFDLAEVASNVVALARSAASSAELTIVDETSPATTVGDAERLRQVVTTLVANSLVYTPPGGAIIVRTGVSDRGAFVTVVDTGPGIDEDDLPHVFDRFYRGRRTAEVSGSGIGLAVARELVDAHHGTIEARNRPEGGTELCVTIPSPSPPRPRT